MIQDEHVKIKYRISMAKAAFSNKITFSTSKLHLNLRNKLVKHYILKTDQKHLETSEMCCWKIIENSWTDVKNEEV
jgi:hypothetical protein